MQTRSSADAPGVAFDLTHDDDWPSQWVLHTDLSSSRFRGSGDVDGTALAPPRSCAMASQQPNVSTCFRRWACCSRRRYQKVMRITAMMALW
jgi:hypothetical protein